MIIEFKSQRIPAKKPVHQTPKRVVRLTVWMTHKLRTQLTLEVAHAHI